MRATRRASRFGEHNRLLLRSALGFPLDDADSAFQIYITVEPEF